MPIPQDLMSFGKGKVEKPIEVSNEGDRVIKAVEDEVVKPLPEKKEEKKEKEYPIVIEDILLFIYRRTGRYKWQTTSNYLKGKLTNYRDEEVRYGFNWLKKNSIYTENISSASIKLSENGINLLKNLAKI